ncbi:MAG: TonB-dependent receptor [Marinobacter sp.]
MYHFQLPAVIAGASLLALPLAVAAQSSEQPEPLDPIVVTATLGPKTVGESLSSVTEIEERQIRREQPRDFQDLIASQPGVTISSNGSMGKNATVFMRGHESDGTVLLVNGIRIRSATSGSPAWHFLPSQLVNRIEIIRGGSSSLYGADAMGGVVQAFTTPETKGAGGWIEAGAGNLDTQNYGAGAFAVEQGSSLNVGVNRFRTEGAPVVEGGEDKPYDNSSGTFNAIHQFNNGVKVNLTYLGSEGRSDYEGGYNDFLFQVAGLGIDVPVTENWRTSLQFADARDGIEGESFGPWGGPFEANTVTRTSRLENWFTAGVHEFVLGAETMKDKVEASANYTENTRTNQAFFGQALLNFGPSEFHFSLRSDDNEAFGTHETWGTAYGYKLDGYHRVRASAGTAFKVPTFLDLYSPPSWGGNPDLDPEESTSYELGVEGNYGSWFWDFALYQSDVDNLVIYDNGLMKSLNVKEARLRGFEVSGGWKNQEWTVRASTNVGDYEDRTDGSALIRRPEQTVRLDVDRDFADWFVGTTVRAESHRYSYEQKRIPGFGMWNLRAGITLGRGWSTKFTLDNVLDEEHKLAQYNSSTFYIGAGRTYMATIRYDFIQ